LLLSTNGIELWLEIHQGIGCLDEPHHEQLAVAAAESLALIAAKPTRGRK